MAWRLARARSVFAGNEVLGDLSFELDAVDACLAMAFTAEHWPGCAFALHRSGSAVTTRAVQTLCLVSRPSVGGDRGSFCAGQAVRATMPIGQVRQSNVGAKQKKGGRSRPLCRE